MVVPVILKGLLCLRRHLAQMHAFLRDPDFRSRVANCRISTWSFSGNQGQVSRMAQQMNNMRCDVKRGD